MNYSNEEILVADRIQIETHLHAIGIDKVKKEIIRGLKSSEKFISPKFFYDERGSELFEKITSLEEYYPTRTEKSILSIIGTNLNINFEKLSIVELGSGDNSKIRLLLSQISETILPTIKYIPVDISRPALEKSAQGLLNEFPTINITGIVADFIHQLNVIPKEGRRLFCFFGSTIGNLSIMERKEFLQRLGSQMQAQDSLLIGLDMLKEKKILEHAYNDSKGVTASFNKNILNVINKLIDSNFKPQEFTHVAFLNEKQKRIEMHLRADNDMSINIPSSGEVIHLKRNETIHTENSHKFTSESIHSLGLWSGLEFEKEYSDANHWFSLVHYLKP